MERKNEFVSNSITLQRMVEYTFRVYNVPLFFHSFRIQNACIMLNGSTGNCKISNEITIEAQPWALFSLYRLYSRT